MLNIMIVYTKNNDVILKCDVCGRFISYDNFISGKAINILITPDSYYLEERYESICKNCNDTRKSNK